jgi:ribosome modulation factor
MIETMRRSCVFVVVVAAVFGLSACRSTNAPNPQTGPFVKYSVSGQSVTVISAKTPFDDSPAVRDAFLRWFKRGFETGLAGKQPLMIEWQETPEGRAGQRGYDSGMDEGAKYRETRKASSQSVRTAPIPL